MESERADREVTTLGRGDSVSVGNVGGGGGVGGSVGGGRVGDIAYRDEDGYYYICDLRSDMIIAGGMKISPAEIEAVLHSYPAVMDAAVVRIPYRSGASRCIRRA
jgi:acyl-CoA synthetase (AMP-forming)/AMP-acid ligase II